VASQLSELAKRLTELTKSNGELAKSNSELAKASRKQELEPLLIQPTYSVSTGTGIRSPKSKEERLSLKVKVCEYYGLWASENDNNYLRKVYPMLQPAGSEGRFSVDFTDVHLAHIWPSSNAVQASAMKRLFGLDEGFHLHPRNFLLLEKHVAEAFDNEALLLLPRRAVGDTPPEVWSRPLWLAGPAGEICQQGPGRRGGRGDEPPAAVPGAAAARAAGGVRQGALPAAARVARSVRPACPL
jgi:hypothetical protein